MKPIPSRLKAYVLAAGLLSCWPVLARELDVNRVRPTGLTVTQAKKVLLLVLKHERVDMNDTGWYIEEPFRGKSGLYPGYRTFSLRYNDPRAGTFSNYGHYAINVMTGDVWNASGCKHVRFPALTKLQHGISKRTGKPRASTAAARDEVGC